MSLTGAYSAEKPSPSYPFRLYLSYINPLDGYLERVDGVSSYQSIDFLEAPPNNRETTTYAAVKAAYVLSILVARSESDEGLYTEAQLRELQRFNQTPFDWCASGRPGYYQTFRELFIKRWGLLKNFDRFYELPWLNNEIEQFFETLQRRRCPTNPFEDTLHTFCDPSASDFFLGGSARVYLTDSSCSTTSHTVFIPFSIPMFFHVHGVGVFTLTPSYNRRDGLAQLINEVLVIESIKRGIKAKKGEGFGGFRNLPNTELGLDKLSINISTNDLKETIKGFGPNVLPLTINRGINEAKGFYNLGYAVGSSKRVSTWLNAVDRLSELMGYISKNPNQITIIKRPSTAANLPHSKKYQSAFL